MFTREDGTPLHPVLFSQSFEGHARRLGLSLIRLHDLRHTYATLALQAGINIEVVSETLGHATVGFTLDVYSHVIPAMQEEAAEQFASLISGNPSRSCATDLSWTPVAIVGIGNEVNRTLPSIERKR